MVKTSKGHPLPKERWDLVEAAIKGKSDLSLLSAEEKMLAIAHYRQFEFKNSAAEHEFEVKALNWARIQFLEGKGAAPGQAGVKRTGESRKLYDFVEAYRKHLEGT